MFEFRKNNNGNNEIMRLTDNCYVSFNPCPLKGFKILESDTGGSETALVIDGNYYVLNGDFREEFRAMANIDVAKCVDVFENNRDSISSWSCDQDPIMFLLSRIRASLDDDQ